MALALRPNCEYCDRDLPPASTLARICTYECTFCADCVDTKLHNVCPNCGGGFAPRPIRPAREWRPGLSVAKRPPSDKRVHLSYSLDDIAAHSARIKDIKPEEYVGIFFSGGRAPEYIREDESLLAATRWFWEHKKPMMSVCHGVEIPARAGIVNGAGIACR